MTTVAEIYIKRMVPLGQTVKLLELLAASLSPYRLPREVPEMFRRTMDTLALLNCYFQTRGAFAEARMSQLDRELGSMVTGLQGVLQVWVSERRRAMSGGTLLACRAEELRRRVSLSHRDTIQQALEAQLALCMPTIAAIHSSLGYSDAKRTQWLNNMLHGRPMTPLLGNNPLAPKPAYWLTLVNNMPWSDTVVASGMSCSSQWPLNTNSEQGVGRVQELLATLPGYEMVGEPTLRMVTEGNKLPDDIQVSTKDGLLVLSHAQPTVVEKGLKVDQAAWDTFCAAHPELMAGHATRQNVLVCSIDRLPAAVKAVMARAEAIAKRDTRLVEQFTATQQEEKATAILAKATSLFSEQELALLAKRLAARDALSAALQG